MKKYIITSLLLFCANLIYAQNILYVSTKGSDILNGTINRPFRTISKAISVARLTKVKHIVIRKGSYYSTNLLLDKRDSGLILSNYKRERVVIYGGSPLDSLKFDGKFIYRKIPGSKNRSWDFRMLIVNDTIRPLARYPSIGELEYSNEWNYESKPATEGFWQKKPSEEELKYLFFKENVFNDIDPLNAELSIFHQWDETYSGVNSIDSANKVVELSNIATQPLGSFAKYNKLANKYVIWNTIQGMLIPGNWYLDRRNEVLYYYPKSTETIENITVIAPRYSHVIEISEGTQNITITGIEFRAASNVLQNEKFAGHNIDAIIYAKKVKGIKLDNIIICESGGSGISVTGNDNIIKNVKIENIYGGGVYISGRNNTVINCDIKNIGIFFKSSVAINGGGKNNRFVNNSIFNVPYSGICEIGDSSLIEKNYIYNSMTFLQDGAAIYNGLYRNIIIKNNYISNNDSSFTNRFKVGIYCDENAVGCLINNNSCVNVFFPIHCHLSKKIKIFNNLFESKFPQTISLQGSSNVNVNNNIFFIKSNSFTSYSPFLRINGNTDVIEENYIIAKDDILLKDQAITRLSKKNYVYNTKYNNIKKVMKMINFKYK
ncbi:right-handed parallel beta-helix repeat-containing protein [Siphonobacter sp. SORGH_AS_1065]|uniref:right-handed parallel beta-helix repeat-containing protein n=1 Tax=Siphonobacter sp. SORGH_AS_1065 TaxID=3041795 RepID=UPI00278B830E|nr:right-handed parallel beta-helix repeat-containing protein [Siphonobacter sp. SORGH_AS_1065]MDQ1086631.1 hypothetical protein [Siphonobacter sp. SORGH_AS_1065]